MDPKLTSSLESRFRAIIWHCLDSELYKSALFWSERYFFHDRENHPARHLYALSLLRNGHKQSAFHLVNLLDHRRCQECVEIYAKCCTELGRFSAARDALETIAHGESSTKPITNCHRQLSSFPEKAVLLCRAGIAAMKGHQPERAISHFKESLKLNPFLWEAFECLCALGSVLPVDDVFVHRSDTLTNSSGLTASSVDLRPRTLVSMTSGMGFFTPDGSQPVNPPRKLSLVQNIPFAFDTISTGDGSYYTNGIENSMLGYGAPRSIYGIHPRTVSSTEEFGPAPKKARNATTAPGVTVGEKAPSANARQKARPALHSTNLFSSAPAQPPSKTSKNDASSVGTRRSSRLTGSTTTKEPSRLQKYTARTRKAITRSKARSQASEDDEPGSTASALSPSASPMLSQVSDDSPEPSNQANKEAAAADKYLFLLLRQHAVALQKMSLYDCAGVVSEVDGFSEQMQRSPWALSLVGRAYYEMVDYQKAENAFKEVRRWDPYRLTDMELYSTLLWHLKKGVRLSFLAQELVSIDAESPQAWIAIGNCFSLQKERSKALSCFQRAAQLDPSCAYAYTLTGHESVDDDLDKAIGYFETALHIDPRHYNAWYGLGTCYLRLSKLRQAEYHYRRAVELHPTNAILLGCLGMAVERRGLLEEAFNLYKEAVRLSPDNALVRYRRAKLLISMQRYQAALEDLLHLRNIAPDESNVVYQLARLYRLMGNTVQSALQLATARDLSPQSMNKIKKLVETTRDNQGGGDEEAIDGSMDEG